MSTAKVFAFPGVTDVAQPATAQPQPRVIEFLQDMLARAQTGQIQAIAAAFVMPDHSVADAWRLGPNTTHQLVAGVGYLQSRMLRIANDADQADAPTPPRGA